MEDSLMHCIDEISPAGKSKTTSESLFPKKPHSAIIAGQTGCGKTVFILDLLKKQYQNIFKHIVILCPTVKYNQSYKNCSWVWSDPEVYIFDPGHRLHEWLKELYNTFQGSPTLYIIDDMSASKALTKKKDTLSELAFSGRHAQQSIWVCSQRYNSVLKDLREQTQWVGLFHCKDRDSFDECLRENDVVPPDQRASIRSQLAAKKHSVLVLNTNQPGMYKVLNNC